MAENTPDPTPPQTPAPAKDTPKSKKASDAKKAPTTKPEDYSGNTPPTCGF